MPIMCSQYYIKYSQAVDEIVKLRSDVLRLQLALVAARESRDEWMRLETKARLACEEAQRLLPNVGFTKYVLAFLERIFVGPYNKEAVRCIRGLRDYLPKLSQYYNEHSSNT